VDKYEHRSYYNFIIGMLFIIIGILSDDNIVRFIELGIAIMYLASAILNQRKSESHKDQ
jgi:hypothetical protein